MIRFFRTYINQPLSIVLGLYMVNLSIDAADMEGRFDPMVNEIESIFELVLEVVMDKGDVLPEHDEPDPESRSCFLSLDHIIPISTFQFLAEVDFTIQKNSGIHQSKYLNPCLTHDSPPPRG